MAGKSADNLCSRARKGVDSSGLPAIAPGDGGQPSGNAGPRLHETVVRQAPDLI